MGDREGRNAITVSNPCVSNLLCNIVAQGITKTGLTLMKSLVPKLDSSVRKNRQEGTVEVQL